MSEQSSLESIVDPFVAFVGGERILALVGNHNPPLNADYLFRSHGVIAELKSLQAGSFIEPFRRKMAQLTAKWQREGKLLVFGTTRIESARLPTECQDEMFSAMAEPLQKHVVSAANDQIKSTKKHLGFPEAKGLLWVASDGNEFLQPDLVWHLLQRILNKKKSDGTPAYSSVHGVAYFNPRMYAKVPGIQEPALFWLSGYRQQNSELQAFLDQLSKAWPIYVSCSQRTAIREVESDINDMRFFGIKEELMRVTIIDPDKK